MTFSASRSACWVLVSAALIPMPIVSMGLYTVGGWWWPLPPATVWVLYVPFLVRSIVGDCRPEGIYVRFGVIWRREMRVPFSTLRTYEIWAPPLHRVFRCRTVILRFAGGSVWLPLLATETAAMIVAYVEGR